MHCGCCLTGWLKCSEQLALPEDMYACGALDVMLCDGTVEAGLQDRAERCPSASLIASYVASYVAGCLKVRHSRCLLTGFLAIEGEHHHCHLLLLCSSCRCIAKTQQSLEQHAPPLVFLVGPNYVEDSSPGREALMP